MAQFKPVRIRPLKEEDLSAVARWNNDAEVGQYMDGPQPKTLEECRQWFADCRGSRNQRLFALETLRVNSWENWSWITSPGASGKRNLGSALVRKNTGTKGMAGLPSGLYWTLPLNI